MRQEASVGPQAPDWQASVARPVSARRVVSRVEDQIHVQQLEDGARGVQNELWKLG